MRMLRFIVEGNMTEALEKRLNAVCRVKYRLPAIGGYVVEADASAREILERIDGVKQIHDSAHITAQMDIARQTVQYGGHEAQVVTNDRHGNWTGRGVTIAILDTGVAPVEDLTTPRNRIVAFVDFIKSQVHPYDDNAHGTHVGG